jgi:hypothetical protein
MTLELVLRRETLKVPVWKLARECNPFGDDCLLLNAQYAVRAPLSVDDFRQFVLELEEKDVAVTNSNISGLSLLSDEFGFRPTDQLSAAFKGVVIQEAEVRQSQTAVFTFQRKPGEWQWK